MTLLGEDNSHHTARILLTALVLLTALASGGGRLAGVARLAYSQNFAP